MKLSFSTRSRVLRRAAKPRGGFTLVEMMVVIGIAALLSGILFTGFQSMKVGNRRLSCQTNLIGVYQAARLYQADEGAFPYFNPDNATDPGIGLWQLYTFPNPSNPAQIATPGSLPGNRYLRHISSFHCPAHQADSNLQGGGSYNSNYLSYQTLDGTAPTYDTIRTTDAAATGWKRQLLHYSGSTLIPRPPADDTVVTWCQWHRKEGSGYDNVLFYDGSVDLILPAANLTNNWLREPRGKPAP